MVNTNKSFYRIMREVENELFLRAMLYDITEETGLAFDEDALADALASYGFDLAYLSLDKVNVGPYSFWCLTFSVAKDDQESPWVLAYEDEEGADYYVEAYVYNIDAPELSEFGEVLVHEDYRTGLCYRTE